MARLAAAAFGAVLVSATFFAMDAAQAANEKYLAECVDQILRRTPDWGAMRKFRDRMKTHGFSITGAVRESDPQNGKSWTAYNVQIRGDNKAYRIACMDR